jgi:hypothetical protein
MCNKRIDKVGKKRSERCHVKEKVHCQGMMEGDMQHSKGTKTPNLIRVGKKTH